MLTEDVLKTLNDHLATYSYLGGYQPNQEDYSIYSQLASTSFAELENLSRWYKHLKSFPEIALKSLPQTDLGSKMSEEQTKMPESNACLNHNENQAEPPINQDSKTLPGTKKNSKLILKPPKGSRDYGPAEMVVRRQVFDTILDVFRMHGAEEIETPVFELKDVLTGKYGEDAKLIYDLKDQGGEILSLRYDLTVPFARYVAMNKIVTIKRYHIARVYRRDNPAMTKGRYREFYQCDFDIAGQYDQMVPDAECVQLIHQVFKKLDLGEYVIKVNHRRILDGIFGVCGVPPEKFRTICSAVDKLDKLPWEDVKKEMVIEKGLSDEVAERIGAYVKQSGKEDLIAKLRQDENIKNSKDAQEGLNDLSLLFEYCKCLDCDTFMIFDMGLARGLDYYTGVIFETILKEGVSEEGAVGSVVGGGRYDNLVGMFDAKNKTVPCVGLSFGIERLFAIQERKQKLIEKKLRTNYTQVYVASPCKGMLKERLKLLAIIQEAGIYSETSLKNNVNWLKQLQFAEERGVPLSAVLGESEVAEGIVKLRVTSTREEKSVPRSQLIAAIQEQLKTICS